MSTTTQVDDSKQWDRAQSVDNISSTPTGVTGVPLEYFEKLHGARFNPAKTFGNPAPVALAGLVMCLTPLSCQLMGWRGSDSSGAANNGAHIFCGGLLLLLGGILEFFLGHTFSFVVFSAYGGFFFALGATLMPFFNATPPYAGAEGGLTTEFYNSFGFFYLFIGLLSVLFLVCSIRTNIVLVVLFLAYSIAFPVLAAADWQRGQHNEASAHTLEVTAGAACFVVSLCGWYALAASLLDSVDMPISLPMGDLSKLIPARKAVDEESR
ncbi:GPR1/FUN34/yaaH family-domain-containing protein [Tricharina praecox]|uniref:GPR1/FUN34/yaaH family-domain-containing protein n=1 Tax=Tricharina praecox TaxID=43433 RepID=UPI00221E9025|nr:GPR1/FUN34/yaaH family-domain-containing protein [Tricharina praecox]KAI5854452.1 GPR1/FUN34/yaaH family-domain-containing protein [Tricharina praecox]